MKELFEKIINFINTYFKLWHFLLLLGCILIFIGLIIFFVNLYKNKIKAINRMINELDNIEHLSIDILNKTVYYFSKMHLDNPKIETLNSYLTHFDGKNRVPLNRWILSLSSQKNIENAYFEQINFSKDIKSYVKDIFVFRSLNVETNMIHLDHHTSSLRNKRHPECIYMKADYEIERCFFKLKKKSSTLISLVTFYSKNTNVPTNNYSIDRISRQHIIDIILHYCDNNHLITQFKNGDLGIIILNYKSRRDHFLEKVKAVIAKYYATSMEDFETFHITSYNNPGATINYNDCIKKIRILSNHLIDTKNFSQDIFFYTEGQDYPIKTKFSYIDATKKILQTESVECIATPFLRARDSRIVFYGFNLQSETMDGIELCEASYTSSREKEYLELYLKKCLELAATAKEKAPVKDVLITLSPVILDTLITMIDVLKQQPLNFIFNFKNDELMQKKHVEYAPNLRQLQEAGFDLCLTLNDCSRPYDSLLKCCRYIGINQNVLHALKKSQDSMLLSNLFTKLRQSKKIIIAYDVPDWMTYETLICNYVTIFNGRFLDCQNEINPDISKRVNTKIKDIYHKYF